VEGGSLDLVKYLISKGADVNAKITSGEDKGKTALDIVRIKIGYRSKRARRKKNKQSKRIERLLLKHGGKSGSEITD